MEINAKLPKGKWLWPSAFLLPTKDVYGRLPDGEMPPSGEFDIIEVRGHPTSINDNAFGLHMGDHRLSYS